ncbi:MAG: Ig-like domain-containing protein [Oligoflexia bacterium]|nr:Ig-like domain-containing protein [Oligoflexia bacterium]
MKSNLGVFLSVLISFNLAMASSPALLVKVIDQKGQAVTGAVVQVGKAPNSPFAQNTAITNSQGIASFNASSINGEITDTPITIVKTGYPKITYFNQSGIEFKLQLPPPSLQKQAELSGDFVGWDALIVNFSDIATFGLFLPFLNADKLFAFQMSDLISTQVDKFSVLGKDVFVPSNLIFPKQRHSYGIIPITLNKPIFRLPMSVPATYSFQAVAGQFPFDDVAGDLVDGKTLFDIINQMTMQKFGLIKDKTMSGPVSGLHMNVNEAKLGPCLKLETKNAPLPKVAGLALTRAPELVGKPYQPTDIKNIAAGAQNLSCIKGDSRPVNAMALAMNYHLENEAMIFHKGMSSILARNIPHSSTTINLTLKSYFSVPQLKISEAGGVVESTRPERQGISPTSSAVHAILSDVTVTQTGTIINESVRPQWIVFGNSTLEKIQLPTLSAELLSIDTRSIYDQIAQTQPPTNFKRWEYIWLGLDPVLQFDNNQLMSVNIGYDLFESMTHAARNAVDF